MGKNKRAPGVSRQVTSIRAAGSSQGRSGLYNVKQHLGPTQIAQAREQSRKQVRTELSGMLLFI